MLKIGEFSKLSRVSVRMLRRYDEIGLLRPVEIDRFTGYRYYSERQLERAGRIRALRDMGFSLAMIGEMLECEDCGQFTRYLKIRKAELIREAEEAAYRLKLLDTALKRLRKDETMINPVTVKTIPERTVASLRMTIPSYADEGMAWNVLLEETDALRLVPDDPCLCCVVFHDSEYKEADVDIEIQKSVKGNYKNTEHVFFKTEPAVFVASSIHNGSYDGLDAAMGMTAQWVEENGYKFSGPAFLIYHVSPHETKNPDEFVTEICYPVTR